MGVMRSLSCILKTEGARGFYKGNGASVLRIVPYAALHFAAYEQYRHWIIDGYPAAGTGPVVDLLAGSLAGGTAVLCTYPLDLARTRLAYQVNGQGDSLSCKAVLPAPYKGIKDVCTSVFQEGGIRCLYRGVCPTLYGILPYAGLKFFVYETLKANLSAEAEPPLSAKLACGAVAGVVGQTVTYPLDVVRRQMQVQSENALVGAQYKGTLDGLICIAQRQGWKQLFAGLGINYLKLVPSAAIGFAAYDSIKGYLRVPPREKKV
jgi:solute carrier family 25 protein 16